ncbi:MAG TPA: hypothetical protein VMH22_06020 [bacterium]|nr:hypothetical protein [bacterium]
MSKVTGTGKALLLDENGQTMLEYVVIVVFVCIVMGIALRVVGPLLHRSIQTTSTSIVPD